jgi:hypothetical protein
MIMLSHWSTVSDQRLGIGRFVVVRRRVFVIMAVHGMTVPTMCIMHMGNGRVAMAVIMMAVLVTVLSGGVRMGCHDHLGQQWGDGNDQRQQR